MGEILSKESVDLLKNVQVRNAVHGLMESDAVPASPVSVEIKSAEGVPLAQVNLRIAST